MSTLSPNMNLILPGVGTESGPQWATDLNSSLSTIDQHNHSSGNGVQITPSGLNMSASLPMQGNLITGLGGCSLNIQSSQPSAATELYAYGSGGDLYWNDNSGNKIKMTSGGAVNATSSGISSGTANAQFVSGALVATSSSGVGAAIDAGAYVLRYSGSYPSPSGNAVVLQAPSSLATEYAITFPATLPPTNSVTTMSTTGQIGNVDLSFLLPTGCLLPYAGSSAPNGFLLCDGSYYSTTTYAALFAVIGYTYGGSGSSFKIPDTRGIFVRGAGTQTIGSRTYSASLGTTNTDTTAPNGLFASTSVSISDPGHAHGINLSMNSGSGTHPVGGIDIPTTGNNTNVSTTGITATASTTLGGNSETSPAYTVVLYIIKT